MRNWFAPSPAGKRCFATVILAALAGLSLSPVPASAGFRTYNMDIEFSGATAPEGTSPWVTATFADHAANHVRLTINNLNLVGTEFMREFYFNFNGALGNNLLVTQLSGVGATISPTSQNTYKADGDGLYDVLLTFPSSGTRFGAGAVAVFDLKGTNGAVVDFESFHFLSQPDGGNGPFNVAAKIQGIGASGAASGWIANDDTGTNAVPVPPTIVMAALGLVPFAGAGLRRLRRKAA